MLKVNSKGFTEALADVDDLIKTRIPKMAALIIYETTSSLYGFFQMKMMEVFDSPTRWTLQGLLMYPTKKRDGGWKALITNPEAYIWFKDEGDGGTPAIKFLWPEVHGGRRERKRYEEALLRYGILPSNYYTVPGEGAKIDKNGNMETKQLTEILTGVRALEGMANTKFSGIRGGYTLRKSTTANFFVVKKKHGGLVPGIWERLPETGRRVRGYKGPEAKQRGRTKGDHYYPGIGLVKQSVIQGRRVRPVLIFVKGAPQYDVRFPFYEWGQAFIDTEQPKIANRIVNETLAYHTNKK